MLRSDLRPDKVVLKRKRSASAFQIFNPIQNSFTTLRERSRQKKQHMGGWAERGTPFGCPVTLVEKQFFWGSRRRASYTAQNPIKVYLGERGGLGLSKTFVRSKIH